VLGHLALLRTSVLLWLNFLLSWFDEKSNRLMSSEKMNPSKNPRKKQEKSKSVEII